MSAISEEAVKAMPERIYAAKKTEGSNCVVSFDTPSLDYNVEYVRADLALPHLPGVGVKVKPLEWVATGQTGFLETEFYAVAGPLMHTVHPLKDVDGPFNEHYSIHRDWNDRETWRVTYYVGNNGLSGISKACKSLEAAKAAAQADYEARILSALESSAARELALADLEEIQRAVFGTLGSEPDVYADYDRLCELSRKMREAIRALSSPDHADAGKVEGEWHRENEDRSVLLYTLRQDGWRKGKPVLVNDVTVRVERCPGSSADISHIADTILSALPSAPSQEGATTHPSGGDRHGE